MDLARQALDEVERERLMQTAEHYGRIVNIEQEKIDSCRDSKEKVQQIEEMPESSELDNEESPPFPDFIANLK